MISNGSAQSIGYSAEDFDDYVISENPKAREYILQLNGSQCKEGDDYRTVIIFKCGKTLVCRCHGTNNCGLFTLVCKSVLYTFPL